MKSEAHNSAKSIGPNNYGTIMVSILTWFIENLSRTNENNVFIARIKKEKISCI